MELTLADLEGCRDPFTQIHSFHARLKTKTPFAGLEAAKCVGAGPGRATLNCLPSTVLLEKAASDAFAFMHGLAGCFWLCRNTRNRSA